MSASYGNKNNDFSTKMNRHTIHHNPLESFNLGDFQNFRNKGLKILLLV